MAAPKTLNTAARSARGRIAALSRSRQPDDPDLVNARKGLQAARLSERIHVDLAQVAPVDEEAEEWAARVAASLPPLTAPEAAALGKLAAALDARRTT